METAAVGSAVAAVQEEEEMIVSQPRPDGVVWFGVVWCGVVWCGLVWFGVVWFGVVGVGPRRERGYGYEYGRGRGHGYGHGFVVCRLTQTGSRTHRDIFQWSVCLVLK